MSEAATNRNVVVFFVAMPAPVTFPVRLFARHARLSLVLLEPTLKQRRDRERPGFPFPVPLFCDESLKAKLLHKRFSYGCSKTNRMLLC